MIPYGKHSVDQQDIDAVVEVLQNQFLTQGQCVPQFEQALCEYTSAQYAVAVNSGTSALHIACLAADVRAGDLVWTVPNSFVASANCALYCGADVDFVDIDPVTRNISVQALEAKLVKATRNNLLPKALVVVHFSGSSCDMKTISQVCKPYGIFIIEDAAHGLGGEFLESKIGSCEYSHMAVLSFHPVKSITTAEGGAVTTNHSELAEKLALYAKHGVTRSPELMQGDSHGPWYYQQIALGYNYRLSDIHAVLGLSQLKKLDEFIHLRREKAAIYQKALADLPIRLPQEEQAATSAWHLYMIEVLAHDRKEVFEQLQSKGVGVNVHYIPIHMQPYYQSLGFNHGDFPHAENFYQKAITLPLFPAMTADEQSKVIDVLHEVLG